MDILQEIKTRIDILSGTVCESGIKASVRHIEVAEQHLARARKEHEDNLFNDVIYRSNQAFEGMLKEAYAVLTESDASKKSPQQIEQLLLKDKVLFPRVLDLFKNYRQNWRNPSTHDHTLFFSEQEALLAIVNVSAFAAILVDQITETLSFRHEEAEAIKKRDVLSKHIEGYNDLPFLKQVISLLLAFSKDLSQSKDSLDGIHEAELIGRLGGFLTTADPLLRITREMRLKEHIVLDMVLSKNDKDVVIEMKRIRKIRGFLDSAIIQISNYLTAAKQQYGVLYIPPFEMDQEMNVRHLKTASGREIVILSPKAG